MSRGSAGKKSGRLPDVQFHMSTRRRASATQRPNTPESNPTPTKPHSSTNSSPLSSPPTSLGSSPKSIIASPTQPTKRSPTKRKVNFDQFANNGLEAAAVTPNKKAKVTSDASVDQADGDRNAFGREPPRPPLPYTVYGADGKTRSRPSEQTTESRPSSPPKALRGGGRGRGRGGRVANGGGRGRGRARDHGDRDDTPEPPPRKHGLTEEERGMITSLKARQQELKKFFQVVGAQQNDLLDLLAARDMAKLVKKPKAHKKVPEYEATTKDLEQAMEEARNLFRQKHRMDVEAAEKLCEMEKELIEQRYRERVTMAQKEHIKGAEGEIMLLEQAGHAANDETRTEAGSETDAFPMYHKMPEAGRVRGYNSTRIVDEKVFQPQVTTFNDQVRREVIDDEIIGPMARDHFEKNAEYKKEQAKRNTMNMTALSEEAMKQLKEISGYLIPQPVVMSEIYSIGLSALADAAEYKAQRDPRNNYEYAQLPPCQLLPVNPLNFAPLPGVQHSVQQGAQHGIQQGIHLVVPPGVQSGVQHVQSGVQHFQSGVQHVQSGVQHVQPGVQHVQPGVQLVQSGVQHVQPGVQHVQSGVQHVQPGVQHVQPGVQHVQPGVQHVQPSVQHVQPSVQHVQSGVQHGIQPGVQQGVRHGTQQRRAPPPQPAQTFIFQPPHQFVNRQQQRMPPPPQPIPVTFVNSTVSSRKSGNKGGQRILLPKIG